jgi:virulence factor Mce-like protein
MIVALFRTLGRHKMALSTIGLVAMLVIAGGYLLLGVARVNPFQGTYRVTVELPVSGGLQTNNDVTLNGYRIGRVSKLEITAAGVAAVAEIESNYQVPRGGTVAVAALSAAGEQYIDFRPRVDHGPYLSDGDVISGGPSTAVTTPTPAAQLLTDAGSLMAQIDPHKIGVILTELDKALAGGPDQLRDVVDGLSIVSAGLITLLPQTTNLVANLRVIAADSTHAQPDLETLTRDSTVIFEQAAAADAELRALLDTGPGRVRALTGVLTKDTNPLTKVIRDFVAITRAVQLRQNALDALFPAVEIGSKALGVPAHDGYFNTLIDVWPRPVCEYDAKPLAVGVIPNYGRVRLWNYCTTSNPNLQIRGSANAPRPDVPDNGAQMPPGVDPNQMSTQNPDSATW